MISLTVWDKVEFDTVIILEDLFFLFILLTFITR